jgi:hypothetical protein
MWLRYRVLKTVVAFLAVLSSTGLGSAWAQQEEGSPAARQYQESTAGVDLESIDQGRDLEQGGPEGVRAEASRQDPGEQERQGTEQSADCPGAELVSTVGPTGRDLRVGPFDIDGDRFRLTYKTTDLDENGVPFLDVTVLDKDKKEAGGRVIRDEGTEKEIVTEAPGRFTLETRADDLRYEIAIEDCAGEDQSAANHQYRDDLGSEDYLGLGDDLGFGVEDGQDPDIPEDVIAGTIPDSKALPYTGGPTLFGLAAVGLACIGLGVAVLRSAIRPGKTNRGRSWSAVRRNRERSTAADAGHSPLRRPPPRRDPSR